MASARAGSSVSKGDVYCHGNDGWILYAIELKMNAVVEKNGVVSECSGGCGGSPGEWEMGKRVLRVRVRELKVSVKGSRSESEGVKSESKSDVGLYM